MAEFAASLVAIPTENPPGAGYLDCVRRIAEKLEEIGLDHEVIPVSPARSGEPRTATSAAYPRACLLASHGPAGRTLAFHGHYDVVPASDPSQFRPFFRNGHLFGRGAADMKSGLSAMLYAVKALKRAGADLGGRIVLVFVPDEETGGAGGSAVLGRSGILGRNGAGMLTPEPTGGRVWNGCRGALSLQVTVRGKPAHVGLQHLGVNALERALPVLRALLELRDEVARRATAWPIRPAAARRSILLVGGRTEGGEGFNSVPGELRFTVDRRINPEEDPGRERARILDLLDSFRRGGLELEVEILQEAAPCATPATHPLARALSAGVREATGRRPRFELCPGLLEIRFYAARSVPGFAYGPGSLELAHGPRESVRVAEIARCAAVYALTALRFLGTRRASA
jgi:acetylornithine deacetylase/succinyl-diaminopimelate desuccinylase family protein